MRTGKFFFTATALAAVLVSATLCFGKNDIDPNAAALVEKVKSELVPLDFNQAVEHSPTVVDYFKYYGIHAENSEHLFGTVKAGGYNLAAHVFKPASSRATVIIVHGYCDHAGIWKHVIKSLLEQQYTVAIYEQPGHGLSDGPRASINSFSEYVTVLDTFIGLCRENLDGPYHLAAHSMGGGIAVDYLLNNRDTPLDKVVLVAPLIRSVAWNMSGFGSRLAKPFINSVPRKFRKNSDDREFLAFSKKDPLQTRSVPMKWVDAHRKWEKGIRKAKTSGKSVKILQGMSDTTVKWKYNLPFLEKKFANVDVYKIKKGGHQLINETPLVREIVINEIINCFNSSPSK